MLDIVNGFVYNVKFKGKYDCEFKGTHPTVIIRTFKEKDMFMVIPLTSYTKDKMEKLKKHGYVFRIKSTNSIARIDKYKIIHKEDIRNRWIDKQTNLITRLSSEDLRDLLSKTEKYISTSNNITIRDFKKHLNNYDELNNYLKKFFQNIKVENNKLQYDSNTDINSFSEVFNFNIDNRRVYINYYKNKLKYLALEDIEEIVFINANKNRFINIDKSDIKINYDTIFVKISFEC